MTHKRLLLLFVSGCVLTSLGQVAPDKVTDPDTVEVAKDTLHLKDIRKLHVELQIELKKAINKPK
jgi:hypothetical protein